MLTSEIPTQTQLDGLDEQLAQEAFEYYAGAPESILRRLCEEHNLDFHEEFEVPYNNYMTKLLESKSTDWRN